MLLPNYLQGTLIAIGLTGAVSAQIVPTVVVASDIATSTTWGPPNIYELDGEIHVLDGATLTILPGTVIASDQTVSFPNAGSGPAALCVDRGAMLIARGKQTNPIVFTSKSDGTTPATTVEPISGLPSTSRNLNGSYVPNETNQWGGVVVMGEGYVSYCVSGTTNTAAPSSSNEAPMEGLLRTNIRNYGGGKVVTAFGGGFVSDGQGDNDDSGSIEFVSIRYNGFVAASTVELNGLGLGGVGRETDLNHIESLNSLDDGIEVWGGACRLKYVAVWACGDDSIDVDQGWRGAVQHGLVVQGYTTPSAQGSGLSDNCFEMDGAEQCFWQPVTSSVIANVTVVGMPDAIGTGDPVNGNSGGDHAMAFRDNARVQFHRCLYMDIGDRLVSADNTDGERCNNPGGGYGCSGTLSWAATWTTAASTLSTVSPFPGGAESDATEAYLTYTSQNLGGNLNEVKDSLVYTGNTSVAFLVEATSRGVFSLPADDGINNNNGANVQTAVLPITTITRSAAVTVGGLTGSPSSVDVARVTFLDPRPATSDARRSYEWEAGNNFLDGSRYRGGFGQDRLWTTGWTGLGQYGLIATDTANYDLGGCNNPGSRGCTELSITGDWTASSLITFKARNLASVASVGAPGGACVFVIGFAPASPVAIPLFGGVLNALPDIQEGAIGAAGEATLSFVYGGGPPPATIFTQVVAFDDAAFGSPLPFPTGASFSNVVMTRIP
jgi:hypothetical protein